MVDSDSQIDQGGNPLGEGTIMGRDGELSPEKRDNFMHGSILGALVRESDGLSDFYKGVSEIELKGIDRPKGPVPEYTPPAAPKVTKCPNCRKPVDPDSNECHNCGQLTLAKTAEAYPDEAGLFGEHYNRGPIHSTCPNCRGHNMDSGMGECKDCGYVIPYDGGEWEDMPGADRLLDKAYRETGDGYYWKNPEAVSWQNIGPIHQGAIAALAANGYDSDWGAPGESYHEGEEPPIHVEVPFRNSLTGEEDAYRGPVMKIIPFTHKSGEELHRLVINPMTTINARPGEYKVISTDDLHDLPTTDPRQGKTADAMQDTLGVPVQPVNNMNWTPGMKGRGIVIGGEPHTWNAFDPNKVWKSGDTGLFHPQYVESLGVPLEKADWNSGVEIDPEGNIEAVGGHNAAPFLDADPRLKLLERKPFSFGAYMKPSDSRTNNMEPYESLWERSGDVDFGKGPDQNVEGTKPEHSIVVQPHPELGLHARLVNHLNFLDAHVNGQPVRGHESDIIIKHGGSKGAQGPVVVSVHDPSHLVPAVQQIVSGEGHAVPEMLDLARKMQAGEQPLPPGITHDMMSVNPLADQEPAEQPMPPEPADLDKAAGLLGDIGEMAGIALAPETGGASLALEAPMMGLAGNQIGNSIGGLMSGALSGGGGGGAPAPGILNPQASILAALVEADYETPTSNPDVGVKNDNDPEKVDTHEFNDQDHTPNQINPNLEDSGQGWEDQNQQGQDEQAAGNGGFAPDSPALERADMLKDLLLHYYHSDKSGMEDPMIRKLDEQLEAEVPGYKDQADPAATEAWIQSQRQPTEHVHAAVKESIVPQMPNTQGQGMMPEQIPGVPPVGQQGQQGGVPQLPGGGMQQGHCTNCGGVLGGDGSCPQCGAHANGIPSAGTGQPGGAGLQGVPGGMGAFPAIAALVSEAANHQGPVTPEQISAVQQWLIEHGRTEEVPNVPMDPGNPEYVKILAEIQGNPNVPPTVTPEEQTQPMPPQPPAPGGGMPMPGMAGGEQGGAPMQPMSSFLPDFYAADNVAPRCPKCKSATTGTMGDDAGHYKCHSCGNLWKTPDETQGQFVEARVAHPSEQPEPQSQHGQQANPVGVSADQQEAPPTGEGAEDSSLTWKDTEGNPLQPNQTYQMHNPNYPIPDEVRVKRVKPDGLDVELLGTYDNAGGPQTEVPISKEEMEMEQLTFEPANQNADDQQEQPVQGQTPGYEQVPPSGQTTDEHDQSFPQVSSVQDDDRCPRCGHNDHYSSMSGPEIEMHECYRCGHAWETRDEPISKEAGVDLSYLFEDDDAEDFLGPRRASMREAVSRDIRSVAAKDPRLQAIHDKLEENAQQRTAGRHFTPSEQRTLIDEDGVARNSDRLDLAGTHYRTRESFDSKANGDNVPDEQFVLGI